MKNIFYALTMTLIVFNGFSQETPKFDLQPQEKFLKVPFDANLMTPTGVAINSKGHVFVLNAGAKKLMEFDEKGGFVKSWLNGMLIAPHGLRIDDQDNIWVTDLELHVVLKVSPKGKIKMVLGRKGSSGLLDEERNTALFFKPADVAFGEDGKIYVADGYGNSRIAMFDHEGNYLKTWGEKGTEDGNFDNPHNIVVDKKGTVYVADRHNNRIQLFDANGDFLESWTNLGTPWGLAIYKDALYMTDGNNEKILRLSLKGKILGAYENPGKKTGQFRAAHGIAVDELGAIYVTEVFNWRVQKFTVK